MKYDEDQERTHRLTLQVTYHLGLQEVSSSTIADPGAAAPCTALRVCAPSHGITAHSGDPLTYMGLSAAWSTCHLHMFELH